MSASLDRGATAEKPFAKLAFRAGWLVGHIERAAERIPPWMVLGVIMLISWGVASRPEASPSTTGGSTTTAATEPGTTRRPG